MSEPRGQQAKPETPTFVWVGEGGVSAYNNAAMSPKITRRLSLSTVALVCGLLAVGGVLLWRRNQPPPLPLTRSLWYWHRPFRLTASEQQSLQSAGVGELFVSCGLLYRREEDGGLAFTLAQQWKSTAPGLKVHLVINASADVLAHLESLPDEDLAQALARAAQEQRAAAEKSGLTVVGLQCDLDYPARLLPRYAAMLTLLRKKLPGWQLSATLLTSWYSSRKLDAVLDALDFSVPQFYEGQTPRTYKDFKPLFDLKALERGLTAAGRRGKPFRAGLPSYGHALVFDAVGRLRGMYRDGGADTLADDPQFRRERAETSPVTGSRRLEFVATQGEKRDFRVLFDLPTVASVRLALERVRTRRPRSCTGVVLFRLPEAGETATLPLPSVAALLQGQTPVLRPRVRIRTKTAASWSVIEGGGEPGTDVFVDLINDGDASSVLAPGAVTLDLALARPGVIEVAPGGFAKAQLFSESPESPASALRATGVRWSAALLPCGATITAGPLRLAGRDTGKLRVTWHAHTQDGTTLTGEVEK